MNYIKRKKISLNEPDDLTSPQKNLDEIQLMLSLYGSTSVTKKQFKDEKENLKRFYSR